MVHGGLARLGGASQRAAAVSEGCEGHRGADPHGHIAAGWRRASRERRAGLLGELELLALQLPPVVQPEDPDHAEIIALRAAIGQLITEITIGLADPA
jgi:hypothetical protein